MIYSGVSEGGGGHSSGSLGEMDPDARGQERDNSTRKESFGKWGREEGRRGKKDWGPPGRDPCPHIAEGSTCTETPKGRDLPLIHPKTTDGMKRKAEPRERGRYKKKGSLKKEKGITIYGRARDSVEAGNTMNDHDLGSKIQSGGTV